MSSIFKNYFEMNLAGFERMVDFSKSSLSSEGIPVERSDKTGTAKLFEPFLPEQKGRVLQPPSCERPFALKNRPSEKTDRFIKP